ncbi:MAG: MgtC/SapB family protein [Proteobacteria bacterium]|nr:MgtC/SapB family protein [Pseudomonadota bacterium]
MNQLPFYLSPDLVEMIARLLMAIAAGSLVGLERYHRGHPAGMRTFALVSLTAALLTVALTSGPYSYLMGTADNGGSRVVQGILAGIGFIGAGVIVREGLSVRGLTSAACMWAVSAIGILIGTGEILLGFVGAIFVLTILMFFRWLDRFIPRRSYAMVHAKFTREAVPDEKGLTEQLEGYGFTVLSLAFKSAKSGALEIRASVWAPGKKAADARARLALNFRSDTKVVDFSVEPVTSE